MRLISAGKMLNPDEAKVADFGLTENCYVHCVVTAAPPRLRLPSLTTVEQAEEDVSCCCFFVVAVLKAVRGDAFFGVDVCRPLMHEYTVTCSQRRMFLFSVS